MKITSKVCTKCGLDKSADCYYKNNRIKSGLDSRCKACEKTRHNTELARERSRRHYIKHKDRILESNKSNIKLKSYKKEYYKKNKTRLNRGRILNLYDLSEEAYNILLVKQQGVCAICKEFEKENRVLSIDHDHLTGKVRGLLCNSCNRGLGYFRDSLFILRNSIDYLERI